MMEMGIEPGRLLGLAEEVATRAREEDAGQAVLASSPPTPPWRR